MAGALEFLQHEFERAASVGRPFVTLSYAQSLDGCISRARGVPTPISGAESLQLTHKLRAAHEAILVGRGTLLADDPQLTVRGVAGEQPRPVVLDSQLNSPATARLFEHPKAPWLVCTHGAHNPDLAVRAGGIFPVGADGLGRVAIAEALVVLGAQGIGRVMVEGGAQILTAFMALGLVDAVVVTIAPLYLGGYHSVESGAWEVAPRLEHMHVERCGDDLVLWGRLR